MNTTAYADDFAQFLRHTDEKAVLLDSIKQLLGDRTQISSVLDIGAGDGLLAIPLAQIVKNYTAIERNPDHVNRLRAANLTVIDGEFPCPVAGHYDFVLLSHVISYRTNNWKQILPAAMAAQAPHGKLLIFTYRSTEDDWYQLQKTVGIATNSTAFSQKFDDMVCYLKTQGTVKIETVTTTVKAKTSNEMISSLAFVASNGIPELKERFLAQREVLGTLLEVEYKKDGHYSFPFQHTLIVLEQN